MTAPELLDIRITIDKLSKSEKYNLFSDVK